MLITDRDGLLYRLDENRNRHVIKGVPTVRKNDQDGLFEIQLHPDFEDNKWVYLSYSDLKIEGNDSLTTTVVSRFVLDNDQLKQKKDILIALPYSKKKVHFGGKMLFDNKNRLYVSFGDRGERDINPQDLYRMPGKIHRVNDDGSIPVDNPFVDQEGVKKSIFSYGHRNPQGLAFNPLTHDLWQHEHGPRGGDEINIIKPKKNYGWPVISYGINYNGTVFTKLLEKEGMEQPIHYWTPSIAPCGMTFVTTGLYKEWNNNLLVGSLRFGYLNRCVIENNKVIKEEVVLKGIGRLRNVAIGPDGYIYINVEKPGYIFRLIPLI
ncbi:PQQ-dependent oxidoreductase [Jejuia pallidilutea]|nr:PQQ-dependent sugar dehydrogenase [Jejuia pallidilutea]GAL67981.1 PQQ-dependent oxidoreductase [Jejuia pallidilutea]